MMRHVDLCSGIGGFALGFEWAGLSKPVLFCDIETWSRQILNKHWPDVPIAEDVKVLANDPDKHVPDCEILTAGYPCQPFSVAGARRGAEDDRHIWPEIFTIIKRKRPTWTVFENVYGHISMGIDEVLSDLERENYATRPFVIPAVACDAPHRRDRVWIIARNMGNAQHNGSSTPTLQREHREDDERSKEGQEKAKQSERTNKSRNNENVGNAKDNGRNGGSSAAKRKRQKDKPEQSRSYIQSKPSGSSENVADTSNEGSQGRLSGRQNKEREGQLGYAGCSSTIHRQPIQDGWAAEPSVGRVAHGVSNRVDRIKGLGNAIVPQIAQRIGETIKQVEELNE